MQKKSRYLFSWFYLSLLVTILSVEGLLLLRKKGFFYQAPQYEVNLFTEFEQPIFVASESAQLVMTAEQLASHVTAEAYFVIDNTTQTILLEKNPQLPLSPASTTKLMTVYTALKNYDLDQVIAVSTASVKANNGVGFFPLEQVKVKDLAAASLVSSANDAAYALADGFVDGYEQFVEEMNKFTQELNLTSTYFTNAVGYDHPDNLSTAHDLAVLTMKVFQEKPIAEWMSLKNYVVESIDGKTRHFLFSTNELLGSEVGVIAGKTGTTPLAKEVLVSVSEVNQHQYITVVMGSEDRYQDTSLLLNWLKDNLQWQKVEFPLQISKESL